MNGPEEFRASLAKVGEAIHAKATLLVRGTAQTLANEMISGGRYSPGTPIDTGFHRSHWDASVGSLPQMGSVGGEDSPNPEGATARVDRTIEYLDPGETLYLANNGPAIRRLEFDAWSNQAPDGFVRPAAEAIQLIVDEVAAHVLEQ